MLIFWSTHKQDLIRQGACVGECPLCNQEQAIAVYNVSQTDRVYGMKLAETLVNKLIACEVCGGTFQIPKKANIKVDSEWKISDGLAALADKCGHTLADRNIEMVNRKSIEALLRRIASTRASLDISISPKNFLLSILLGIVAAGLLTLISSVGFSILPVDTFGHGFIGLFGGFILSVVGLPVRDLVKFNKTKRADELRYFMKKLNLTKDDLRKVSDSLPSKDFKIQGLVANL